MQRMTNRPANGTTGILIRSLGEVMFRVYTEDHKSFVDYDIFHSDLQVIINDDDAYFYQKNGKEYLDHSPATLKEYLDHSPATLGAVEE